ncbi:MAG: carboxypeptidase-like regulatory domain-containing protein, partial [Bacteroidales bacterium]|nr:carboxypeptidase-like regulatory domain-containing protein [Bacteroidales bacterium]
MRKLTQTCVILIAVLFSASLALAQSESAPQPREKDPAQLEQITNFTEKAPAVMDNSMQVVHKKEKIYVSEKDPNAKSDPIPSEALFDLQFEWPVGVGGGEAGIECDGINIYTTKWNGAEFYRYQLDGTYIESFAISGASNVRDLAYNGTYFYGGAASTTVFEMDFAGQALISTFTAPTDVRAIGYNETDDVFYANNWGSDITVFDPTGGFVSSWSVGPVGDSYYGFAYDNYSTGAPYLWGYAQVGANLSELIQMELPSGTETGLTFDVGSVLSSVDMAGGLAIDDNLVSGYWTLLGTCQNVNIWGLELCPSGPPPTNDVGVTSIISPVTGPDLGMEDVTINIHNYGTAAQSNFDVYYTIDAGGQVTETISATINGGDSYEYTFTQQADLSAYGTYVIESCTDLTGDENPGNDCRDISVQNFDPSSQCQFSVVLWDDFGDGWNGGTLTISVDGTVVLNNITLASGAGPETHYFDIINGTDITCVFTAGGWPYECSYYIYDNDGNEVFSDGVGGVEPTGGTFTGVCIQFIYGDLAGTVTELATGNPIEGAIVMINDMTDVTISDGTYLIEDVMIGTWDVYCNADGYNPAVETGVEILEAQTTTQDFALTSPTMDITPTSITVTLDPFQTQTEIIDIANNGDGTLDWSANLEILSKDNSDAMFDLQFEWPVGVGGGEAGIECDGSNIYTTKWNGAEFYRYQLDGTYIESFTVTGAANVRDLAYNGTYFYGGAASTTVYEMDFDAQSLVSSFSAPTDVRAIGYNEDDNVFYANNWGSDITCFDPTGALVSSWSVGPVGDSYYGFAYDNYSNPGTPYLWGYAQTGATLNELIQMELPSGTETGLTFDVGSVITGISSAGGLAIDDNLVAGFWTLLGTSQNECIWGLELCESGPVWISIDPNSGTVDPGNIGQMDVNLDATDQIAGTILNANIHFSSDPDVGTLTVPVQLIVGSQPVGHIQGNVFLDGIVPYNIGNVEEVLVEAGPYFANPDANGDYDITAYPGTFDVTATLYGYTTQTNPGIVVTSGGTVTGVDFTMPCIYGIVTGTVTDFETGTPLENAVVTLLGPGFEDITGTDGIYEIYVEAGTYDVQADHATYMPEIATDVVIDIQATITVDFALTFQCQYCDASGGCDEFIDGVEIGTISNMGTGCGNYQNFTNLSTIVLPGTTESLTVHTGNAYSSDDYGVWVDWNKDCVFDPVTENVVCEIDNGQDIHTWDITIPGDAVPGPTTMRIRLKYSGSDCGDPCGSTTYGEVEDYTLNIAIPAYGNLEGYVTEEGTGNPIENALIDVGSGMWETLSEADGYYYIDSIVVLTWDVTCTKDGYNPASATVTILENQTVQEDFVLSQPELIVDPLIVNYTLEPNGTGDTTINISNPGTGTVDWSAGIVVITDDGSKDMFDVQFEWPVGVGGGEAGIECDGSNIYTTKWNGAEFYRYQLDGTYIESFTVTGAANVRDLAYNGTYFYGGAASTTVYEMDFDAQSLVSSFSAPTDVRAIGYNEDDNVFYANNWGSDITCFDPTGALVSSWSVGPVGDSYYGFAYDNYSNPGTPYLWGYAQTGATLNELIQMELPSGTETGLTFDVGSVITGISSAGGLAIDDNLVAGFWTLLGTSQNECIWGLELCESGPVWLTILPTSGTLTGGTNEDMTLYFDADGLLPGVFEAEIHFSTTPNVG